MYILAQPVHGPCLNSVLADTTRRIIEESRDHQSEDEEKRLRLAARYVTRYKLADAYLQNLRIRHPCNPLTCASPTTCC